MSDSVNAAYFDLFTLLQTRLVWKDRGKGLFAFEKTSPLPGCYITAMRPATSVRVRDFLAKHNATAATSQY